MATLKDLHRQLLAAWPTGDRTTPTHLDAVEKKIADLRTALASADIAGISEQQLIAMQMDVLEYGALLLVLREDVVGFQEAIQQVMQLYQSVEVQSTRKNHMLGLNLMCLLAVNRLPEFHMELERVPRAATTEDVYIGTPVKLEQYLIEGAFNKIFLSEKNMPSPYYALFMRVIEQTVRQEIAECIEKAYASIAPAAAARLLFLDGADADRRLADFSKRRGWTNDAAGRLALATAADGAGDAAAPSLDTDRLARQYIFYAKQLEMIH